MLAFLLSAVMVPQDAGDLFSYERWDNSGDELPANKDFYVGGGVSMGDVDSDGTPDIGIVAQEGMSIIRLTPTGGIAGIATYLLQDWVRHAEVAGDVDGYGVDDLVTSEGTLLFMDALGMIRSEVLIDAVLLTTYSAAGLGDLDQDGIPDVALGGSSGLVFIYFLKADGTLKTKVQHQTGTGRGGQSVSAFDLDGDGRKERTVRDSNALSQHLLLTAFLNADGSIAATGSVDVPGDIPWGIFWGQRIESHTDGRLLSTGDSWIDWVTLIPRVVPASSTQRNAGSNLASYDCVDPVLGADLTLSVDAGASGHGQSLVIGFDSPFHFVLPGGQTVLCFDLLGSGELLNTGSFPGPIAQIPVSVPLEVSLLGFPLYTQAVSALGSVPFALSNACDLVLGL